METDNTDKKLIQKTVLKTVCVPIPNNYILSKHHTHLEGTVERGGEPNNLFICSF